MKGLSIYLLKFLKHLYFGGTFQLSSRVIKYQKCTTKSKNKLVTIASIYIKHLNIGLLKASKQNILAVKSNW